jgi:hypothetical protein
MMGTGKSKEGDGQEEWKEPTTVSKEEEEGFTIVV